MKMETKQYTYIDRSNWPPGPWDKEPDKIQFEDEETGLPCLIVRNHSGALCGYVGVPEGHPEFEKDCQDINYEVHGGLTFSDFCADRDDEHGICHVPGKGEPDKVWWLGFDCAHFMDTTPEVERLGLEFIIFEGGSYKTVEYVKREIAKLARQLHERS